MYTESQIKYYCQVLCFSSTTELFKELKYNDNKLATSVADFNISLTLLEAIDTVGRNQITVTYLNVKEHLYQTIFKQQVEAVDLEEKLTDLLPKLQENGLISKMDITELGRKMLSIKKATFHQASLVSLDLN